MAVDPEETPLVVTASDDSASSDVEAFLRLATVSVNRLVTEPALAAELRDSMTEGNPEPLDRLMAAQQVLARVLSYERATLGDPLSAGDLEEFLRRREPLETEVATRLIYELSLAGGRSWSSLQGSSLELDLAEADDVAEADRPESDRPEPDDPVLNALRVLTLGSSSSRPLNRQSPEGPEGPGGSPAWRWYSIGHAADRARATPLGFCRLVLEVAAAADESSPGDASQLARASVLLDDPFLRREAPREWFDLRARAAVYLADRARREGRLDACDAQLSSLPDLLDAGSGDSDLKARVEEVHAGRDLAFGDRPGARRALGRLRRAAEILQESSVEPPDHLVEVRLKAALVLAADPSTRQRAADTLRDLAGTFGRKPGNDRVHPVLQLRTFHAAACVELDLARQAVAEKQPLGTAAEGAVATATEVSAVSAPATAPETGLAAYAEVWREQEHRLDRVGSWLGSAEPLLETYSTLRQLAEHRWYVGQSLLLADRESAARHLRRALADFHELGDTARADRVSIDLIVCGVLAGASGDELDDWSEPLRLFQQLAART